ncbi:MAG: ribbon-helix-helix domain-containing protein [Oscillospiraceae bacterium]|nr:ribbon-helix-helix domain-containing protein [Oscillospiraceae bacterium]
MTTTIQTVSLDNNLLKDVENFKSAGHYQTSSQAIEELVRRAIKTLKEEADDEYLLALAIEREKNDNGVRYSFEEILAEDGLTIEDIDRMLKEEDVELEYELPNRMV